MVKKYIFGEATITKRNFFTVLILVFNALTWYYLTLLILNGLSASFDITTPLAAYYLSTFASGVIGSLLSEKIRRVKFLKSWMLLGAIASLLPVVFGSEVVVTNALLVFAILGASFGIGMPSCFAYFTDHTLVENRGRMSGVIFLATNLGVFPLSISLQAFDFSTSLVISAAWRGFGLVLFLLLKPTQVAVEAKKDTSLIQVLRSKSFLLFLIAWLMFSLIDRLEDPILKQFFGLDFHRFMRMMGPIIGSVSALAAGILADTVGRKRIVIYGFVALGLAYAILGIIPTMVISWFLYVIIDGVAAGILWVAFVLIIWGDLSKTMIIEKYYAVGSIPFFLSSLVPLFLTPYILEIPSYAAFSLASFFLFVAVLPLMYAPETLPEKKMRLRQLQSYAEKAKKLRDKYSKKSDRS